jgi:thiamine kinase-like enzyme
MDPVERVRGLACWREPVEPRPLEGGITNTNVLVSHRGERFVVRVGDDIPEHGILRFNELAAARAAAAAGISPEIVHVEPGAFVMRHLDGRPLREPDLCAPATLARAARLVRRAHDELPAHLRGPLLVFWVFHVARDYAASLREAASPHLPLLPELLEAAARLERAVGPVDIAFCHNDLLPANLIDDGGRLWLIDWDYAGFGSPLFDLANLAANAGLDADGEALLLEAYHGEPPDAGLVRRLRAFRAASSLREAMWSMVSEIHGRVAFDFAAYTEERLARFRRDLAAFEASP